MSYYCSLEPCPLSRVTTSGYFRPRTGSDKELSRRKMFMKLKTINSYLGSSNIQHFVVIAKTSYGKLTILLKKVYKRSTMNVMFLNNCAQDFVCAVTDKNVIKCSFMTI